MNAYFIIYVWCIFRDMYDDNVEKYSLNNVFI